MSICWFFIYSIKKKLMRNDEFLCLFLQVDQFFLLFHTSCSWFRLLTWLHAYLKPADRCWLLWVLPHTMTIRFTFCLICGKKWNERRCAVCQSLCNWHIVCTYHLWFIIFEGIPSTTISFNHRLYASDLNDSRFVHNDDDDTQTVSAQKYWLAT